MLHDNYIFNYMDHKGPGWVTLSNNKLVNPEGWSSLPIYNTTKELRCVVQV